MTAYTEWRAEALEDRPWCEAREHIYTVNPVFGCGQRATEIHHRRLRSAGGSLTGPNAITVCRQCHDWIHAHPAKAHDLKLIIREGDPEWSVFGDGVCKVCGQLSHWSGCSEEGAA